MKDPKSHINDKKNGKVYDLSDIVAVAHLNVQMHLIIVISAFMCSDWPTLLEGLYLETEKLGWKEDTEQIAVVSKVNN